MFWQFIGSQKFEQDEEANEVQNFKFKISNLKSFPFS